MGTPTLWRTSARAWQSPGKGGARGVLHLSKEDLWRGAKSAQSEVQSKIPIPCAWLEEKLM